MQRAQVQSMVRELRSHMPQLKSSHDATKKRRRNASEFGEKFLSMSPTSLILFSTIVCVCSVMSNFLQPHELWPTRLLCPWNFPGKNTGVDCHFLPQGIFLTQGSKLGLLHCKQILYCLSHQCVSCSVASDSLRPPRLYPTRLLCPWDSLGKNTGVDCQVRLQKEILVASSFDNYEENCTKH